MIASLCLSVALLAAEPEKPKDPPPPKIVLASPLAIVPGTKPRVALRGANLEEPKEVRTSAEGLTLKIASKGKVAVPQEFTPERVGDTQVEIDLEVPPDLAPGEIEFAVETAGGIAKRKVLVLAGDKAAWDEGANDAFREAKVVEPGRTVIGLINEARDVDVYRVEAKAGQTIVGVVRAAKLGSPFDAAVTLYGADGRLLASYDDLAAGDDLEFRYPATAGGPVFVALYDANDRGGSTHAYLLTLDVVK